MPDASILFIEELLDLLLDKSSIKTIARKKHIQRTGNYANSLFFASVSYADAEK